SSSPLPPRRSSTRRPRSCTTSPTCTRCYATSTTRTPRPESAGSSWRGAPLRTEDFDGALAHLDFADLAGDGHRELVREIEVARDLVVGELAVAERPQRLDRQVVGAGPEPHPGHELFAVLVVGDTDDLDVVDVRVLVEEL